MFGSFNEMVAIKNVDVVLHVSGIIYGFSNQENWYDIHITVSLKNFVYVKQYIAIFIQ